MQRWPVIRDLILFFAGLGGVMHQTLVEDADRPTLLLLFAAMMGLPIVFNADQRRSEKKNGQ